MLHFINVIKQTLSLMSTFGKIENKPWLVGGNGGVVVGMRVMNTKIRFNFECVAMRLAVTTITQPCSFDTKSDFMRSTLNSPEISIRIYVMNEIWQWLCFFWRVCMRLTWSFSLYKVHQIFFLFPPVRFHFSIVFVCVCVCVCSRSMNQPTCFEI